MRVQYKQCALTWQRSKFIVALKIDREDGWVFHVQCSVAGQKEFAEESRVQL